MARNFNGTSQHLDVTATPASATPLTLAAWWLPANTSTTMGIFNIWVAQNEFLLQQNSTILRAQASSTAGGTASASTVATITANQWNHGAAVFTSATSRTVYLNGGNAQSNTTSITPSGLTTTTIGFRGLNGSNFVNGPIAEAGIWNVALSANEVAALAKGVPPRYVRPQSLVGYWPLWGLLSPEPDMSGNANAMVLTNAPTKANHAPTTLWTQKARTPPDFASGAVAASLIPWPLVASPRPSPAYFE